MIKPPSCVSFVVIVFSIWATAASAALSAPTGPTATNLKATSFMLTWMAATGGTGGIAGYDVYRDGGLIGSTTTRSFVVTSLSPETTYGMTVTARDAAGAVSVPSATLEVTTIADTVVPSRPLDLAATNVTTSSCTLNWTGSTDNVGVTGYNVYRGAVQLGSSNTTMFDITGLAPDTNNNLTVRAIDAAGNLSGASVALAVRTLALPPSTPTGLGATNLKATSFTLTWGASAGGTGGIAGYDVYQSGTPIGSTTTARSLAISGLAPTTTYSMTVVSRDTVGNASPASVILDVTTPADTTAPTRPADLTASSITTTSFSLTWTGSTDNVGVTGYHIYRSGVLLGTSSATSYQVNGLVPDSTNNMTVRAVDAAGNLSAASVALSVRMVALPPSTPTGLTLTALRPSSFTLQWIASTGGTGRIKGYKVYLNGVLIGAPTTRSLAVSGLTPQTAYSMTVISHDSVGNLSAPSEALVVSTPADTTRPSVPKGLSAENVDSTSFTLIWTASTDNVGVTGYDVYRNNLLIGSTPSPTFAVTGLTPETPSSMRLKAKDAAGNISGFSAILPVTTSARPNIAPTITLISPAANSVFTLPFTLALSADAADSDGSIAKVEFFDNGTYLGETAEPVSGQPGIWLLTLSSQLSAGDHSLTARATDNRDATADSDSVAISVNNPNLSPSVALTAPATGTNLIAPGFVTLTADATDSDGVITKVEFYEGGNLLGAVLAPSTPPATFAFPLTLYSSGTYTMTAVATDNSTAQSTSAPVVINVNSGAAALPFVANFEPSEGFRPGSLSGQLSWFATDGVVVVPSIAPGSQQELSIPAAEPGEIFSHDFSAPGVSPVFVDFQANPVVGNDPTTAVMFSTPAAQVALVGTSSPATIWIFGGNGQGWYATNQTVPVDPAGRSVARLRLTTREDYLKKKWDLYLNGQMIAADVAFADGSATALTDFSVNSHATTAYAFDSFYAGPENPLFADANHNGLDDAWETAHGLSLAADNRQLSPTGSGVTVLQSYLNGTDPNDFYSGETPSITIVSGDNQTSPPSQFNVQPMLICIRNTNGAPLANAPVTFTVTSGGGLIAMTTSGTTGLPATLSLRTSSDGTAQVFYQQPAVAGITSYVLVTAGAGQVTFQSNSLIAVIAPSISVDFEATEAFALGALNRQNGWTADMGCRVVEEPSAPSGTRVLSIGISSGARRSFSTLNRSSVEFVQFNIRPAVGTDYYDSSYLRLDCAAVGFRRNGDDGEILAGRESDGIVFNPTGHTFPLNSSNRAGDWMRITARVDYVNRVWDLYVADKVVASDIPYTSTDPIGYIEIYGGTELATLFDALAIYPQNPLFPDSDSDGMRDDYEIAHGLSPLVNDRNGDPDSDQLTNFQESLQGTDPWNMDTDSDGLPDKWEIDHGFNPFQPEPVNALNFDADGDGLTTLQEASVGTHPLLADTDGDGIPDGYEVAHELNPLSIQDMWTDADGDGITNLQEFLNGSAPDDFYNGSSPVVTSLISALGVLGENNSFKVLVTRPDGTPLAHAPVRFTIKTGKTKLKGPNDLISANSVEIRSDADGIATVYVQGERPE